MKKFYYFLCSVILCLVVGGMAYFLYNASQGNYPSWLPNSSEEESDKDIEFDPPQGPEDSTELEEPDDSDKQEELQNLMLDGLEMVPGASLFMGEGDTDLKNPVLNFTCKIDNVLLDEIKSDNEKSLGMLFAPLYYFDEVNEEHYPFIDWMREFEEQDKEVYFVRFDENFGVYDETNSFMRIKFEGITYDTINTKYVGIGVLTDQSNGETKYYYSSYPSGENYRTMSRSAAYVAGGVLNLGILGQYELFGNFESLLVNYLDMAVDKANGSSKQTESRDRVSLSMNSQVIYLGLASNTAMKPRINVTPNLEFPIAYKIDNPAIVEVGKDGKLYGKSQGRTQVTALVAGESITFTVDVNAYTEVA